MMVVPALVGEADVAPAAGVDVAEVAPAAAAEESAARVDVAASADEAAIPDALAGQDLRDLASAVRARAWRAMARVGRTCMARIATSVREVSGLTLALYTRGRGRR